MDNSETRSPLTIDIAIDKEVRAVHLECREDNKRVSLTLSELEALKLGRALRDAVHSMGKRKVEPK